MHEFLSLFEQRRFNPGVQSTNDDATACKWSAVNLGYWADPFINFMAKKGERRAPEIHLGEENNAHSNAFYQLVKKEI